MKLTLYDEKIRREAEYWDLKQLELLKRGFIPDLRQQYRLDNPQAMWEDSVLEKRLRGNYQDYIVKEASRNKGEVIELGCGPGFLSLEIARHGATVTGVDISLKSLEIAESYAAKNRYSDGFGKLTYEYADLNKIELTEGSYDSVVVWDTLHHVENIQHLCSEVKKGLREGGNFLVWDHIGFYGIKGQVSRPLSALSWLIIPSDLPYFRKPFKGVQWLKKKIRESPSQPVVSECSSPFEGVTGREMLDVISTNFDILRCETVFCFVAPIAARIRLRDELKYPLIGFLLKIDRLLIRAKILDGEYVFIHAVKGHTSSRYPYQRAADETLQREQE